MKISACLKTTALVVCLLVAGCDEPSGSQTRYDGLWRIPGYATSLSIRQGKVSTYQTTKDTATKVAEMDGTIERDRLVAYDLTYSVRLQDGRLVLTDTASGNAFVATRQSTAVVPASAEQAADARYNFAIFWQAFNEHYAFFDRFGVDWESVRGKYAASIDARTSAADLLPILQEMVSGLDDAHVALELEGELFSPYKGHPDWLAQAPQWEQAIGLHYVRDLRRPLEAIHYGWLNADTAYINLRSMVSSENVDESLRTLLPVFDTALVQFQASKTLVIDLRFNQGGFDAVARAYAGSFVDSPRTVMFKQARDRHEYTPREACIIVPRGARPYRGRIVLLTSRLTLSAAEAFAQAMRQLPNVTIVGERTAGFFSNVLPLQLPNGIRFGFSNERYFTPDGQLLEGRGVPADIQAPFEPELPSHGKDPALEWVLRQPSPVA